MDDLPRKFVLLQDRMGVNVERSLLKVLLLDFSTKQVPTQVLRGELLEALPEAEQPQDSSKIAVRGIERKSLRLECALDCIMRLTEEDANLLLAISSIEERFQIYMDRIRLEFGKRIRQGSRVFVTVKGISKKLPAVVWYKGELPSFNGTMFGVELIEHQGLGTSDGMFRGHQYFTCPPDSAVFVGLDKLTPRADSDPNYLKKGESVNIASQIKDTVIPSFLKGKNEPDLSQDGMENRLSIGDRVVTFVKDLCRVRGTVRYIGNCKDHNGKIQTILGLELDTMDGEGTGKLHSKQLFVCRKNFAHFTSIHGVIPEKDFDDENCDLSKTRGIIEDKNKTKVCRDEESAKSLGYNSPRLAGADEVGQTHVDNPYGFEVGTMVEVPMAGVPRYGVIRWIGPLPQVKDKLVAGLELEDEQFARSDGTFNGERYFACPAGRGFFTLLIHCRPDGRFTHNSTGSQNNGVSGKAFGSLPSPDVPGITEPPTTLEDHHCGTMHGLQGHHNSCYLDASLYSMFAFPSVFDALLHRQKRDTDLPEYERVKLVLRESIVNPLRVHGFVRADKVLELRELLDKLSSTAGIVNEEKDPEEFLNSLLQQVLRADPFLHLKSRDVHKKDSEGAFFYQIITDKDESVIIAQVQQLLEQSFISADIILSEVPSCLILQMPRFGSRYKLYDMILPNLKLDVTNIVENVPRECSMCGSEVAQFECTSCFQQRRFGSESGIASYCRGCNDTVHSHRHRQDHEQRPLLLPRQYDSKKRLLEKQTMELFAVVCIETSHYVAFVKCGVGAKAAWCFFDSMADRKGESNGYNIPAVTRCPEALEWLTKDPKDILAANERGEIPEKVQRLLGDGYLCMYQNLDMTMYKSPETSPSHFRERQQTLPSLPEQLREGREREVNVIRQLRQAEEQKDSSRRQLMRSKEELENCQQQLRNKEEQLRGKEQEQENLQRQLSEMVQRLANSQEQVQDSQRQMMEMEQRLTNCQEQLQEREARLENSQRQMREMEQRLTNCQEQLREREARLENSQRQVREMEQRLTNCLEQLQEREARLENSQRQMREMEQRLTNCLEQFHEREAGLLEQLRENEQQQENSQRRVREIEQRLTNCQEQLQEREARLQNSQRQVREMEQRLVNFERHVTENEAERVNLERQLVVKDQEMNELETSLSAAQQTISELRRQETCDWVIARDEIQIKDKCLGKGGWGSVNEGTYCGCVVAVKQIHELILSPHNRRLFEREMNIASRCRHPCLLQFIGATNDEGSPLFVTELMETSLRALLEQRELSEAEICVISLDVARALNYLHQRRPSPILHRDVSSANVLLWRRGDQWRGKVSDYGTAKFVQQTMTVAPGALIYSSPEALSSNQTAMVDVYSFGVLLCEMCIRELPDPERRDEQVVLVSNRLFRGLVRRCLETDPLMRPDMAQIIQELGQLNDTMS